MVPLQGNKEKAIKKFFHIKTFDLHHFFKIENLIIRSKKKNSKRNNKTEDQQ